MKWDKALTYLIIMFLCVNIGLAIGNYNRSIRAYKLSDERIQNIASVLKNDEILIQAKLPINFRPMAPVWVLPFEITPAIRDILVENLLGSEKDIVISKETSSRPYEKGARVYTKGSKELKFRTSYVYYQDASIAPSQDFLPENKAKDIAEDFIKRLKVTNIKKKSKIDYKSESYGASLTYYEVYDKFPLYGSYIHLKMTSEGVFEAAIHGNTVEDKANNKRAIYPIDKVLFKFRDEIDIDAQVVVDSIMLGYAIPSGVEMHILREEAIPMYKINLQGLDKPIFVNAYTNTVEELPTGTFYK